MTNANYPNPTRMSSSSSSPPPLLPPTPTPLKLRKKRSKLIKLDPRFLHPNPNAAASSSSSHYHHSVAMSRQFGRRERFDSGFSGSFRHCCPECFKQFGSEKALYGHMRCHPDRDYRGMTRKQPVRYHHRAASTSSSGVLTMSVEDHEVASCLLMLSRTETETDMETGGGGNECHGGGASCSSFECSSCKKVFGSHQALGGHRASHKNVKGCFAINTSFGVFSDQTEEENCGANTGMEMVLGHKCSICSRVFPTGQALGGHKRCHWEKGDDQGHNGNFVVSGGKESSGLDLNLPAPRSVDDDQSCSSYNSSAFNLDLRLGL